MRDDSGDERFQLAVGRQVDSQMRQPPIHVRNVVHETQRKAERLEPRKERFRYRRAEPRVRVRNDQLPQLRPRGETVDNFLANVYARPEPLETRTGDIEQFLKLDSRLPVNLQILQLGEGFEDDCDDVLALVVVHRHHMGREGNRDGMNSPGYVSVIGHRPSEGGDAVHVQVDVAVQPASCFVAEELADKACLTKGAGGVDQTDNVTVKLQRQTSACDGGG